MEGREVPSSFPLEFCKVLLLYIRSIWPLFHCADTIGLCKQIQKQDLNMAQKAKSLMSRPFDLMVVAYMICHIPTTLLVDSQSCE